MKFIKEFKEYVDKIANYKEIEKIFTYFHISTKLLLDDDKDVFTFHIKAPKRPYKDIDGNIIEDDFTKRISLSTSIHDCFNSLDKTIRQGYLYGIDLKNDPNDNLDAINLATMQLKCPLIRGDYYNDEFNLRDWILSLDEYSKNEISKHLKNVYNINFVDDTTWDSTISPSLFPEKYKNLFYACVPDADKHKEFWSTKNLKMVYIGKIVGGDIYLSDSMIQIIKLNNQTIT